MSQFTMARKTVKDGWLKDYNNQQAYIDLIYTAFKRMEQNQLEDNGNVYIESTINKPEIKMEAKKQQSCIDSSQSGAGLFYLIKKGSKMGKILKREVILKDQMILQIKEKGVEKNLGLIKSMKQVENPIKNDRSKYVLEVTLQKQNDSKIRTANLMFEEKAQQEKVWNYVHINNGTQKAVLRQKLQVVVEHFKRVMYSRFRMQIKDHAQYLNHRRDAALQRQEGIKDSVRQIFKDYDKKQVKEFVDRWKQLAYQKRRTIEDADLAYQKQQEIIRNQRAKLFKRTLLVSEFDLIQISKMLRPALEAAYQRKQNEEENERLRLETEEEDKRLQLNKKRNAAAKKADQENKEVDFTFKRMLFPSNLHMTRPVVEISYIAIPSMSHSNQEGKSRKINDMKYQVNFTEENNRQVCLAQQFFFARQASKYNGENTLWNLKLISEHPTVFNNQLGLKEEYLRVGNIEKAQLDYLCIRVYESHQHKGIEHPTFERIIQLKDLANVQSHSRKLWIDVNQPQQGTFRRFECKPSQRTMIEVDVYQGEFAKQMQSPAEDFNQYQEEFLQEYSKQMSDPIYSVFLPNPIPCAYSFDYFLAGLSSESSSNVKSIELLSFLVDSVAATPETPFENNVIQQDFKRALMETISLHICSAYFEYEQKGNEIHQNTISRVGVMQSENPWQICEVVNNIKKFSSELNVNDLRGLLRAGIPQLYRSLYWFNFLQINTAHKDDMTFQNRHQTNPDSFVEGFEFYLSSSRMDQGYVDIFLENEFRKQSLGKKRSEILWKVLCAFSAFLKINKIMDPSQEDNARDILYRFVERVVVCLQPNTEPVFSQLDFELDTDSNFKRLRSNDNRFEEDQNTIQEQKIQQDLAEKFWICVGLFNLQYRPMMAIGNPEGVDALKEKLSRGLLTYNSLLSAEAKEKIEKNNLEESVFTCWVEAYITMFNRFIATPGLYARVLDVLIFEFEINYLDGFDAAVAATFAALLNNINLSAVYSLSTLNEAFQIQSVILPKNFIENILENIVKLTGKMQKIDASQLQKAIQFLRFEVFVQKFYPTALEDYRVAEKNRFDFFNPMAGSRIFDPAAVAAAAGSDIPPEYQSNKLYESKATNQHAYHPRIDTEYDTQTVGTKKNKVLSTTYHLDRRHFNEEDEDQFEHQVDYSSNPNIQNYKAFIPQKE